MANAVFVLDLRCLCTLSYKTDQQRLERRLNVVGELPAPGGPIKIMRIEPAEEAELPPLPDNLASSSATRDSSLWTKSFRSLTTWSGIGAIVPRNVDNQEGVGEDRRMARCGEENIGAQWTGRWEMKMEDELRVEVRLEATAAHRPWSAAPAAIRKNKAKRRGRIAIEVAYT